MTDEAFKKLMEEVRLFFLIDKILEDTPEKIEGVRIKMQNMWGASIAEVIGEKI